MLYVLCVLSVRSNFAFLHHFNSGYNFPNIICEFRAPCFKMNIHNEKNGNEAPNITFSPTGNWNGR